MKFTIAIIALLSAVDAKKEMPVWSLRSTNDFRTDAGIQKAYGDHSVSQANSRDPQSHALMQEDPESDDEGSSGSEEEEEEDEGVQIGDYMPG